MNKRPAIAAFLKDLGVEVMSHQHGNLWLKREHVEDLGGEGDVLALILTTFGKGYMWDRSEEMKGWLVLSSIY